MLGNWLLEPHGAAEDEAAGPGLFFFFFHYEPGRKRNRERDREEMRGLQQITTPFNSIFTIRDLFSGSVVSGGCWRRCESKSFARKESRF